MPDDVRSSSAADVSRSLAVLVSGGLDSAILLGESLQRYPSVWPLYVRFGLFWEKTELHHLRRFLECRSTPGVEIVDDPGNAGERSIRRTLEPDGGRVPAAGTPDAAVYLPGRNVLLLAKAMLWCHLHAIAQTGLGAPGEQSVPRCHATAFFAAYRVGRQPGHRRKCVRGATLSRFAQGGSDSAAAGICRCNGPSRASAASTIGIAVPVTSAPSAATPSSSAGCPDPTDYHRERPCSA